MMTSADLPLTPLGNAIGPTSTISHLDAFRSVRKFLMNGHSPVFDNNFVRRLQL